jgi:ribosomal protein S14
MNRLDDCCHMAGTPHSLCDYSMSRLPFRRWSNYGIALVTAIGWAVILTIVL